MKELSDYLSIHAPDESSCFPIDRYYLQPFVHRILEFDKRGFLLYNFEDKHITYVHFLMLCLHELWERIDVDDIIYIVEQLQDPFSLFAIIMFMHRYLEIDILFLVFYKLRGISSNKKKEVKTILLNLWPNLIRPEDNMYWNDEDILGIRIDDWRYIKQKLLLDPRLCPAMDFKELSTFIENI